MAAYETFANGKHPHHNYSSGSSKRPWWPTLSVFWLVFSIYPVFVFFFGHPSYVPLVRREPLRLFQRHAILTQHQPNSALQPKHFSTVTRTVVMPSLVATALPGSIDMDKPENAHRLTDVIDIFEDFETSDRCRFSSLDLHGPFEPLCQDKESLLRAMSWGGRIGTDAPFSPRGCDMRWFSPTEICVILSKFSAINIVGDSMMRNLAVAMHIYLRADLNNGGRSDWSDDPEGHDCRCEGVFDDRSCTFNAVASTSMAHFFAPGSVVCQDGVSANVEYHNLLEHPIKEADMEIFLKEQPPTKPKKPAAFVFGHGLWNDLDKERTYAWLDQATEGLLKQAPWLGDAGALFPRLFLTPNAAGDKKPDIFIARQGNIALMRFEKIVGEYVRRHGFDHLGTYNMSIQAYNPDGTHGGMKVNLIKAMMIFNWLNAIDVSGF